MQKAKEASEAALIQSGIGEWSMRKQGQANNATVIRLQIPAHKANPPGEKLMLKKRNEIVDATFNHFQQLYTTTIDDTLPNEISNHPS